MPKYTENGVNSISFRNALAKAKRNAGIEKYGFIETILDVVYGYNLTAEETEILKDKLVDYCKDNYLYKGKVECYRDADLSSYI